MIPLVFREPVVDPVANDQGIVYSTWLTALARAEGGIRVGAENEQERMIAFKKARRPAVAEIINNPKTSILLACPKLDPLAPIGWAAFQVPNILHFVYVFAPWRRQGIGRALLTRAGLKGHVLASHYTSWGFPKVRKVLPDIEFDPLAGIVFSTDRLPPKGRSDAS